MAIIMRVGGGGGGGLDLTVLGGTTQPENPKNNTLWINTEVEIGDVYLAPTAPESPATGDVWVNTSNRYQRDASAIASTTHVLEVAEDPFLRINVLQFKQWDGTAWVWRDGGIYANNAWTDMALYIYWYGTENANYPITNSTVTKYDDYFSFYASGTNSTKYYRTIFPEASVDTTPFTTIGVGAKSEDKTVFYVGFAASYSDTTSSADKLSAQKTSVSVGETLTEISVPITVTGTYYPGVQVMSAQNTTKQYVDIHYWVLT